MDPAGTLLAIWEHPIHFNRFPPDPTCRTCFRKRDQREQQGALIGSSCFRTCCAYTNATHQDLIAHLEMLGTFVHQALSLRKIHRLGSWHGEGNQVERERARERGRLLPGEFPGSIPSSSWLGALLRGRCDQGPRHGLCLRFCPCSGHRWMSQSAHLPGAGRVKD